ncbi:MAG: hypothetical protein JWM76_2741 [Pseudonocardiales bacterium]|nr:hypothetical protein [Pseudonocardiales bacterium]
MLDDEAGSHPLSGQDAAAASLRDSLLGLAVLTVGVGQQGLKTLLHEVAALAVGAIPGAEGVGVTLLESGRPDTIVASADFVREVDAIQYGLGEGPCITAATERRTVHSNRLGAARDWPRFGPKIAALGVHSVLSLPLVAQDRVVGAMNVYAHPIGAFTARAQSFGEFFAAPAAASVHNAQALHQARRVARELQVAMTTRSIIDQALGVIMSRTGCSEDEAFERLKTRSQARNIKVSVLAENLMNDSVRRAQARHTDEKE